MTRPARSLAIIDAPTNLGLAPLFPGHVPGTRRAPYALRTLGLHGALNPTVHRRVEAETYQPDGARRINIRNIDGIARHALQLADAVEAELAAGHFTLVLGGDCSVLLGTALANARIGPRGLVFLDGHTDFYLPEQSGTGGAAGMDLALATGWGPAMLAELGGKRPLVEPARVAALGNRDFAPRAPTTILPPIGQALGRYLPLDAVRALGTRTAMDEALMVASPDGAPFWIHLDVDILTTEAMPAVDSPQPGGLSFPELEALLAAALDGNAAGMHVTIYDPDKDPDGKAGAQLVKMLTSLLA